MRFGMGSSVEEEEEEEEEEDEGDDLVAAVVEGEPQVAAMQRLRENCDYEELESNSAR